MNMKKYLFGIFLLLFVAGCSNGENTSVRFTEQQAVPFEIMKYDEKIAPVFMSLVPHIAYANTQAQFESLQARFDVENFSIDMEKYIAVFIVTYSDSCGTMVDGVYNHNGHLSVQLIDSGGASCEEKATPHTFVLQAEKGQYEKVELYNGNIIKSSVDVEE